MKKTKIFMTGMFLMGGGCFLLCIVIATVLSISGPCGWLDSYVHYTGCTRQFEVSGSTANFSPDLKLIAVDTFHVMNIWQVDNGKLLNKVPGYSGVFSPDGSFFVTASTSLPVTLSVWRTRDWNLQSSFDIGELSVSELAISPDMSNLAIVFREPSRPQWQLQVWKTDDGTLLHNLEGHTDYIESIAYSPDGKILASGGADQTVRLWQMKDGHLLKTLQGHENNVAKVVFSPDGRTLASSDWDHTIRLWRTGDGTTLYTLKGQNRIPYSITFSPDGSVLATGGTAGLVQLWDMHKGTLIGNLRHNGWGRSIEVLAFSPDGKILATVQLSGTVRLFDIKHLLGLDTD
jgi:WD40 repeat protein